MEVLFMPEVAASVGAILVGGALLLMAMLRVIRRQREDLD